MNAAEDRLAELMEAATSALQPPLETILAEGERLGRSRRRRRRAAVAAGTAAVVLLAGTGAAAGLRLTRGSEYDTAGVAPTTMHRPSRAPSGTERASPSPTETAAWGAASGAATPAPALSFTAGGPLVSINATAAYNILRMSLPTSWTLGGYKVTDTVNPLLNIDVNDGMGLAQIFVGIGVNAKSGMDPIDCKLQAELLKDAGSRPPGAPPASCAIRRYTNGDLVMQEVLGADPNGLYQYRIITDRADGIVLEITASNGYSTALATRLTRAQPPLSVDQWTAIAMQRAWQLQVPVSLAK